MSGWFAELLGQLRLLALQLGQLGLLLLDERVRQDGREVSSAVAVVLQRPDLVVRRFLLDPLGLGARDRARSGRPASARRCSAAPRARRRRSARGSAAARLSLASTCLRCSPRRCAEPVGRFLRRRELELEVLLDVRAAPARWRRSRPERRSRRLRTPRPPGGCCGSARPSGSSRKRSSDLRLRRGFVGRRRLDRLRRPEQARDERDRRPHGICRR